MNAQKTAQSNPLNIAVDRRGRSVLDVVRDAIKHRDVMLAFQPVMQAGPPHGIAFYEGLIRVIDETGRVVPARDFMPEVVDNDLGRLLDCHSLDLGLQALSRNPDVRLSINMSARSIGYQKWGNILDRHLKQDKALGDRLMLEIEAATAMHVPELVIDFMDRLQPKGIAFALDNFGAGDIALRHLRDFFFDAVKIDGSFVRGVAMDPDNRASVRALIAIAREFEMLIVANSVETIEDAEFLAENGADCLQGYLFGAPSVQPPWTEEMKEKARA